MTRPTDRELRMRELRQALDGKLWRAPGAAPAPPAEPTPDQRRRAKARARRRAAKAEPGYAERQREAAHALALELRPKPAHIKALIASPCRECGAPLVGGQPVVWLRRVGIFCNDACASGWVVEGGTS